MKYLIKNGLLLHWDGENFQIKKDDIFINGSTIEKIGELENTTDIECYEIIDAEGQLVMPGLINSHTHAYMSFMKNSADDFSFNDWLFKKIIPIETKMQEEDFYWGTLLGCLEMIKTGTTSYLDMHISNGSCATAAKDSGMRAFIGKCIRGDDINKDASEDFLQALKEKDDFETDLVKFVLSPHSVYACSGKLLEQIEEESKKRNMLKHIHLSESKNEIEICLKTHNKTPVEFLDDLGFLDNRTFAAHCVKVNDNDIRILKDRNVNVVTNPSSNSKLGNGISPVVKLLDYGVNVCLGTDSAASNNTLNMIREMNIFSILHKVANENPSAILSKDILMSSLINPARAFGLYGKLGSIEEGAYADIIFIDLNAVSLFPNNNIINSLCSSANGSEVVSSMINGQFVMRNRKMLTIDEERIYYEIKRIVGKYL